MRPGWNPTRRNRNIGTANSGSGRDNRLTIPQDWRDPRVFWERLRDPVEILEETSVGPIMVLVEPTTQGFAHPCTPDDVVAMIEMLPAEDVDGLSTIVLRQPRRNEAALSPVWGRLGYWADIGRHAGPTVFFEAQEVGARLRWSPSLRPDKRAELERLVEDGHSISRTGRYYECTLKLDPCRSTQLFRTLLHEIGHYVDKRHCVDYPLGEVAPDDSKRDDIVDRYWSKPEVEKEAFAHRYAYRVAGRLRADGKIPFEPQMDISKLRSVGLDPGWFGRRS